MQRRPGGRRRRGVLALRLPRRRCGLLRRRARAAGRLGRARGRLSAVRAAGRVRGGGAGGLRVPRRRRRSPARLQRALRRRLRLRDVEALDRVRRAGARRLLLAAGESPEGSRGRTCRVARTFSVGDSVSALGPRIGPSYSSDGGRRSDEPTRLRERIDLPSLLRTSARDSGVPRISLRI